MLVLIDSKIMFFGKDYSDAKFFYTGPICSSRQGGGV